jgi:hypothetical protein
MAGKINPGALAGATGVGMTFKAGELNVIPIHTTFDGELHHRLRVACLQRRHGLTGSRADLIASLAFDGGRR